jgi:hypothetical protein
LVQHRQSSIVNRRPHDRCRIKPGMGVRRVPELCPHLRFSVTCGLRLDDHIERAELADPDLVARHAASLSARICREADLGCTLTCCETGLQQDLHRYA